MLYLECINVCWLLTLLLFVFYDSVAVDVHCLEFLPESLGYNFQMMVPCPVFALFRFFGWLLNQSR